MAKLVPWQFRDNVSGPVKPNDSELCEIGIIRHFPFVSSLQRMSVIELSSDKKFIYCKISPEKISELSKIETLPRDFEHVLSSYTEKS